MRILTLILSLFLISCQSTNTSNDEMPSASSPKNNTLPKYKKSSLYDRYKYKNNRYTQYQDTAPNKQHAVNLIEPVPVKEPLSRYGNPSEYNVDGRHYEVLKNATGYRSRGIASWYGTKFHKQRTSSGDPYNMYVMTAAHKTLPLPTYIKVRNLNNGKEAIVKVNDRGPFHSDRILDLSYAAAVKLGIYPNGTAPVEIITIMGPTVQSKYYVQAGAFSTRTAALQLQHKLQGLTREPVFVEHYQQHYIVRVGPITNKNIADSIKVTLAHNGVTGSFSVLI